MPDLKPPRLVGDERETLLALLQFQRESLVRKITGVDDQAARSSPVVSGTTLLWLMKHMARAESLWILRRFAGREVALPDEAVSTEDTLAAAVETYRATWNEVDPVVDAAASLDEVCRDVGDESPGQPALGVDASVGGDRPARRACRHPPGAHRRSHRPVAARVALAPRSGDQKSVKVTPVSRSDRLHSPAAVASS